MSVRYLAVNLKLSLSKIIFCPFPLKQPYMYIDYRVTGLLIIIMAKLAHIKVFKTQRIFTAECHMVMCTWDTLNTCQQFYTDTDM